MKKPPFNLKTFKATKAYASSDILRHGGTIKTGEFICECCSKKHSSWWSRSLCKSCYDKDKNLREGYGIDPEGCWEFGEN